MRRLDEELVFRGLAKNASEARRLVLAGLVSGSSERFTSPALKVAATEPLHVKGRSMYVSRGGYKLQGALEAFHLDVSGFACVDLGASTGGFTDCLLQRDAAFVVAVDVAYGQFAWKLRNDPRVELLERTNARVLAADPRRREAYDLVVMDISFAAAASFLELAAYLLKGGGELLCLVKPQFELEGAEVASGGVVRSAKARERAVDLVRSAAVAAGFVIEGSVPSPIRGAKGNQEHFLLAQKPLLDTGIDS